MQSAQATPAVSLIPESKPPVSGGTSAGVSKGLHGGDDKARYGTFSMHLRPVIIPGLELARKIADAQIPTETPGIGEAIECYLSNVIDSNTFDCWMELSSAVKSEWQSVAYSRRERPKGEELSFARNRELLSPYQYFAKLRENGVLDTEDMKIFDNLRHNVPGPSDLVRFAVRHVFEPDLLAKFNFNGERDKGAFRLDAYHHTAGLDYPIFTGPLREVVESVTGKSADDLAADYTNRGLPEPTWAHAYWWSHWILPAASQGYQFYFRLDPSRDTSFEPDWMKDVSFNKQDLFDLLRMNDYPEYFRDKLLSISYTPPQLRFMRLLYAQGQMDEKELADQMRRLGMMPKIADSMSRAMALDIDEKANPAYSLIKSAPKRLFATALKAYKIGAISKQQLMATAGEIGMTQDATETYAQSIDVDIKVNKLQKIIAALKADYLMGAMDIGEVSQILQLVGVPPERTVDYTDEFTALRTLKRRIASTEKILSWLVQGIIPTADATNRLTNLGWTNADMLPYLAEANQKIAKREAQQAAANLRSVKQNAAALAKAAQEAKRQHTELVAEIRRLTPPGKLIKWARQGSISEQYFEDRLRLMDFDEPTIAKYWQEVIKDGPIKPKK